MNQIQMFLVLGLPSNVFFFFFFFFVQLVLISWILTLSSCLISQIISFILTLIVRHFFENHGYVAKCVRKLCTDFGGREASSAPYVCYPVKKVKETGILINKPKCEKPKTVRTPENVAAVAILSQQLNISKTLEANFA